MTNSIAGKVIEVTTEGDLITDITSDQIHSAPRDESLKVIVDDEHETIGLYDFDHQQPEMTLIAIADQNQPIRLHLVGDSAAMMLGVRKGADVLVKW